MLSWDTQTPLPRYHTDCHDYCDYHKHHDHDHHYFHNYSNSTYTHMKYNAVIIDTMVMIAMQRYGDW